MFRLARVLGRRGAQPPPVDRNELLFRYAAPPEDDYELAQPNVAGDWTERSTWIEWEPPRNCVAGESHHMDALRVLAGPPRENGYLIPVTVRFVREPDNPYDRYALRAEVDGLLVGYLRRHVAAQVAPAIDEFGCAEFSVCGVIRGGGPYPNIGVHVWLGRRTTPGPEFVLLDQGDEVRMWPPQDYEGC